MPSDKKKLRKSAMMEEDFSVRKSAMMEEDSTDINEDSKLKMKKKKKEKKVKDSDISIVDEYENDSIMEKSKKKKDKKANETEVAISYVDEYFGDNFMEKSKKKKDEYGDESLMKKSKHKKGEKREKSEVAEISFQDSESDDYGDASVMEKSKHKKGKKRKKSEVAEMSFQDSESAPKKHKKEMNDSRAADVSVNKEIWTNDEMTELLVIVKSFTDPESKLPFTRELKNLDWDAVKEKLACNRMKEHCQKKFKDILGFLKYRNLYSVLSTCEEILPEVYVRKNHAKINVRALYASKHKDEIMTVCKNNKINYFSAWKQCFDECPEDEKASIQEEVDILNKTKDDVKLKEKNSSPFGIYYSRNKEKISSICTGNKVLLTARNKWDGLSETRRLKYIVLAVNMLGESLNSNPDLEKKESFIKITKKDAELYLSKTLNMPVLPPRSGRDLCMKLKSKVDMAGYSGKDILSYMTKLWEEQPDKEKWNSMAKEGLQKFKNEFKAWASEQTPATHLLVKHVTGKKIEKLFDIEANIRKRDIYMLHKIEMPMSKIKFADAPIATSKLTPLGQYTEMQRLKGATVVNAALEFRELSLGEQERYSKMVSVAKEKLAADLLAYVKGLSDQTRGLYLGFYRTSKIKIFRKDIFEDDYPVSKFKVFMNTKHKSVQVVDQEEIDKRLQQSYIEAGGSDSSEEEEDEEAAASGDNFLIGKKNERQLPDVKMASINFSSSDSD